MATLTPLILSATAESLTTEDWEKFLTIWDKLNSETELSREAVTAIAKRLSNRSAQVQLLTLSLADSLVANCSAPFHVEANGKLFLSVLQRTIADRNTHATVAKRIYALVLEWAKDHKDDEIWDPVVELAATFRRQFSKFDEAEERPTQRSGPSDSALRQEEADMQRAIAESEALAAKTSTNRTDGAGYVKSKDLPRQSHASSNAPPASTSAPPPPPPSDKFVKALYQFVPSPVDPANVAPGIEELPFETGDIIRVLECVYNEWWRGELIWLIDEGSAAGGTPGREIGRKGIFPTVYVEEIDPLSIPPPRQTSNNSVHAAAQQSRTAVAQVAPISTPVDEYEVLMGSHSKAADRMLFLLSAAASAPPGSARGMQGVEEFAEIQYLAGVCVSMRAEAVRMIESYRVKLDQLYALDEKFSRAQSTYMMLTQGGDTAARQEQNRPMQAQHRQASYSDPRQGSQEDPRQTQHHQQQSSQQPQHHQSQPSSDPKYPQQHSQQPGPYQQAPSNDPRQQFARRQSSYPAPLPGPLAPVVARPVHLGDVAYTQPASTGLTEAIKSAQFTREGGNGNPNWSQAQEEDLRQQWEQYYADKARHDAYMAQQAQMAMQGNNGGQHFVGDPQERPEDQQQRQGDQQRYQGEQQRYQGEQQQRVASPAASIRSVQPAVNPSQRRSSSTESQQPQYYQPIQNQPLPSTNAPHQQSQPHPQSNQAPLQQHPSSQQQFQPHPQQFQPQQNHPQQHPPQQHTPQRHAPAPVVQQSPLVYSPAPLNQATPVDPRQSQQQFNPAMQQPFTPAPQQQQNGGDRRWEQLQQQQQQQQLPVGNENLNESMSGLSIAPNPLPLPQPPTQSGSSLPPAAGQQQLAPNPSQFSTAPLASPSLPQQAPPPQQFVQQQPQQQPRQQQYYSATPYEAPPPQGIQQPIQQASISSPQQQQSESYFPPTSGAINGAGLGGVTEQQAGGQTGSA